MATVNFTEAIFTIEGGTEHVVNKESGGTIEAGITNLASPASTVWASGIAFYTYQKGTGAPEVTLQIADLLDGDLYSTLIGAQTEEGITILGTETSAPFTSLILISETKEGVRMFTGLTKGKFTAPDVSLGTVTDQGGELKTDTIQGTFQSDSRGYTLLTAVESETVTLAKFKAKVNGTPAP